MLQCSYRNVFTIQNVPIKFRKSKNGSFYKVYLQYKMFLLNFKYLLTFPLTITLFTIQNVPIKFIDELDKIFSSNSLQYKMFLLNQY